MKNFVKTVKATMFTHNKGPQLGTYIDTLLKTTKPVIVTRNSHGRPVSKNFPKIVRSALGVDILPTDSYLQDIHKFENSKHTIVDLRNTGNLDHGHPLVKNSITPDIVENFDKFKETEMFKGFIPRSKDYKDIAQGSTDIGEIRSKLDTEFGQNKWIVKRKNSDGRFEDSVIHNHRLEAVLKYHPDELFVQEMKNLKPKSEYRVHVYNGKVIPFATFKKGSKVSRLSPGLFQTKELRGAENYAQQVIKSVPEYVRKNKMHGFDIAVDADTNKYVMIESNILERNTGTSGFLDFPQTQDAFISAGKGKLPKHIIAGRTVLGVGALTAATGAYYTKKHFDKKAELSDTQKNALIGTGVVGALAATAPLAAYKLAPGIGRNRGAFKGYGESAKNLFINIPKSLVKGESIEKHIGIGDNNYHLKLSPTKIRERSNATKGFDKHTVEAFEQTKKRDIFSTVDELNEQENIARKAGKTHIVGITHFSPEFAARFGYSVSDAISPKASRAFIGHFYNSSKKKILKKLSKGTLNDFGPTDAYVLAADPKQTHMFIKDLRDPEHVAIEKATKRLKGFTSKELDNIKEKEKEFVNSYHKILRTYLPNE